MGYVGIRMLSFAVCAQFYYDIVCFQSSHRFSMVGLLVLIDESKRRKIGSQDNSRLQSEAQ